MPLLIRLSEYMSIMIPSSLKIHQSRGQLHSGAWSLLKVHVQIFPVLPQPHINILAGQNTNLGTWASACLTHENQTSEPLAPQRCPGSLRSWGACSRAGKLAWHWQCQELEVLKVPLEAGPHCSSPSPACIAALALLFFAQNHSNDAALTLSSSLCL